MPLITHIGATERGDAIKCQVHSFISWLNTPLEEYDVMPLPSSEGILLAKKIVYSPTTNEFWSGSILIPHECISIRYSAIQYPLYKGYELIIEGTVGSVLLFDEPKLSEDEINQLYDKGKLPLDYNGNLVLPYCES